MPEISSQENEDAVSRVYMTTLGLLHRRQSISIEQRLVFEVEHLMQEANSGASFEQYFRWASLDEITRICSNLEELCLIDLAELTSRAIRVALPEGLPTTDEEKADATYWSEDQETLLRELFLQLENENGRVMNVLGAYVRRAGI